MNVARVAPLLLVLVPVTGGSPQSPKVVLRFGQVVGTPFSYVLRDGRGGREQLLYVRESVVDSAGIRILRAHVDSAIYLIPGGRPPQAEAPTPDIVVRVDDRREWVDSVATADTILDGLRALVLGRAVPLPEAPVGVGDSWKAEFRTRISYHYDPSNEATAKAKVKVKSINVTDGDTTVVLTISMHLGGTEQPRPSWPDVDVGGDLQGEETFSVHTGMTEHLKLMGRVEWDWRAMGPRGFEPHTYATQISLMRDTAP